MPLHDWARVDAGTFHAFHNSWTAELQKALNTGLLPKGYYALAEQHGGRLITDVITLHDSPPTIERPPTPTTGGLALAEAPPRVRRKLTVSSAARSRRRTLTIRHVTGHRVIALLEIVSPANKDRLRHVEEFVSKVVVALEQGIHVTVADLFKPGPHDPQGMNGAIWDALAEAEEPFELPADSRLTLAAYVADAPVDVYLEYPSVGQPLADMPIFLTPDHYVYLPLESTYQAACRG